LAAASGLLYFAAFPPLDLGALAFVALVPLLLALRGASGGRAFLLGWLTGSLGICLLVSDSIYAAAARYFGGGSLALATFALLLPQVLGALWFGVFAWLARGWERRAPAVAPLLPASAWVACELARSWLGWGSPWVLLGHSQHERLWLVQIADLGGVLAVSFVVAVVNGAFAAAISHALPHTPAGRHPQHLSGAATVRERLAAIRRDANRSLTVAAPIAWVVVLLGAAAIYGHRQLEAWDPDRLQGERLDLVLVQPNLPTLGRATLAAVPANLRVLVEQTRSAPASVDLVVWPENAIGFSIAANPGLMQQAAAALPPGAHLLLGAPREVDAGAGAAFRNSAFLLDGRGDVRAWYDKLRLTPFAETSPLAGSGALERRFAAGDTYTPGDTLTLFSLADTRFAVLICWEAIYADLARAAVRDGAEWLVNISNDDWFGGRAALAQHRVAAGFRAVETRRFLARATNSGLTTVFDPRGERVADLPAGVAATASATVLPIAGLTFYARHGDAFACLCVALFAALRLTAHRAEADPPHR